jgi:hypothetical protein
MKITTSLYVVCIYMLLAACENEQVRTAGQWQETEITLESVHDYENPYTDVDVYVIFKGPGGTEIRRPAFWDGINTWKVRFASPYDEGTWNWESFSSNVSDPGLHGKTGTLESVPYTGNNPLIQKGLLRMSAGHRNVIHADGSTFFVIGDTPWAMPFRGTVETVTRYAQNRQERGFNAALLMSVQPDRNAEGPRNRYESGGFGVAFEDLKDGHLNHLNVEYFQKLDQLTGILLDHGIVPVYNPVFQGFGWKGLHTLGAGADPGEYSRYTKYLIARYGARHAMWLVSADGTGREPVTEPAGITTYEWDAYRQPTGIHYSPFDDRLANWSDDPQFGFHFNKTYQEAEWLDFQWAQTGHDGTHLPHKVYLMYDNEPTKGVANGEPTYERISHPDNATGWWQGHEAWINITSGGTMGHVYGAGGLWNWKLSAGEPGWPAWANTEAAWYESIEFEGSRFVGYVSKALAGLDLTDIERRHDLAGGELTLAKEGELYIVYLPEGGEAQLEGLTNSLPCRWFNPKTADWLDCGTIEAGEIVSTPDQEPWVLIAGNH